MTRLRALLIALALWAGIYLPGLDAIEFKGEEGRRVMPAVTMLETGDWVVPSVGGEPFLRKPPLVQWCIAASIKVFGPHTWSARLPSVLSVYLLAAVIIVSTRGWLSPRRALAAAIIAMTQVAMIDKCRLAELEAVYLSLSGMAVVIWMSAWVQQRSSWAIWILPMVLNALAFLAKAPLHLLFFYAIVACVLAWGRETRQWWSLGHLTGLVLMAGIIAAWAIPYYGRVDHAQLAQTLNNQAVQRFTGAEASLGKWLMNIPNGVADHLPWILFAPLLWRKVPRTGTLSREAALLRGGRWAVAGCFVGLLLIPGVLPRYILPLTAPFSLLLVLVLPPASRRVHRWARTGVIWLTYVVAALAVLAPVSVIIAMIRRLELEIAPAVLAFVLAGVAWRLWLRPRRQWYRQAWRLGASFGEQETRPPRSWALVPWVGACVLAAMVIQAAAITPWTRTKDDLRPFARDIDQALASSAMPADEKIVLAYSVGDYAPLLGVIYYLQHPVRYVPDDKAASKGEAIYLVRGKALEKFSRKFRIQGEPLAKMDGKDGEAASVLVRASKER